VVNGVDDVGELLELLMRKTEQRAGEITRQRDDAVSKGRVPETVGLHVTLDLRVSSLGTSGAHQAVDPGASLREQLG
jgi:hypothetical protein